jgi:hypothetical protein
VLKTYKLILSAVVCLLVPGAMAKCPSPVTHIRLAKGDYSPQPGVRFALQDFEANQVARGKASPLCYMRTTDIQHGDVFIDTQSLSREFVSKTTQTGSAVHDFRVETKDHLVDLKGTIKKLIPIRFTMEGPVTTDGHLLFFHATSIKADGIPVKGLLGMLGKHLDNLLQSETVGGVSVKDDTIIFEPEKIAHVRGRIASTEVTTQGLFVKFAAQETQKTAALRAPLSVAHTSHP